jgi:hypothetical protein
MMFWECSYDGVAKEHKIKMGKSLRKWSIEWSRRWVDNSKMYFREVVCDDRRWIRIVSKNGGELLEPALGVPITFKYNSAQG